MLLSLSNFFIPILVLKLVVAASCRGFDPTSISLPNSAQTPMETKYVVSTRKATWSEAFVLCQQNGMELATITTKEEEDAIERVLSDYSTTAGVLNGYYVSGTRHGACINEFVWLVNGRPIIYSNFGPGQPDNYKNNEACIEIYLESIGKYKWNDRPCDSKAGFICQPRPYTCSNIGCV